MSAKPVTKRVQKLHAERAAKGVCRKQRVDDPPHGEIYRSAMCRACYDEFLAYKREQYADDAGYRRVRKLLDERKILIAVSDDNGADRILWPITYRDGETLINPEYAEIIRAIVVAARRKS